MSFTWCLRTFFHLKWFLLAFLQSYSKPKREIFPVVCTFANTIKTEGKNSLFSRMIQFPSCKARSSFDLIFSLFYYFNHNSHWILWVFDLILFFECAETLLHKASLSKRKLKYNFQIYIQYDSEFFCKLIVIFID